MQTDVKSSSSKSKPGKGNIENENQGQGTYAIPPTSEVKDQIEIEVDPTGPLYVPLQPPKALNANDVKDPNADVSYVTKLFHKYANQDSVKHVEEELARIQKQTNETYAGVVEPKPVASSSIFNPDTLPQRSELSKVLDTSMKTSIASLAYTAEKAGVILNKSTKLAEKWEDHVSTYDKFIKSLSPTFNSNLFKIGAFIAIVGIFVFQMGLARKIPEFVSSVVASIPIAAPVPSVKTLKETIPEVIPVPTTNMSDIFFQHPLACVGIVGCVVGTVGGIKLTLYALKLLKLIKK